MPVEKSAGTLIFRKEEGKIYYLLLHYPPSSKAKKDYWDFAKGHIEKGESEIETAGREVFEETGLKNPVFLENFKEKNEYFFKFQGKTVFKTVVFYLAETKVEEVKLSHEHIDFKWLAFEKALNQLTFANSKEILKKANGFLLKRKCDNK
ncbi:MAG: NUDIX domain-containing protein [bacterium]